MFRIALVFGTLYIVGRGVLGMLITMPGAAAATVWPCALWTLMCLAAARSSYAAYRDSLRHLQSRRRLRALARPATLAFLIAGLAAPRPPAAAAAITFGTAYALFLAYAAVLTALPGTRDRIDRFRHGYLCDEQRATDLHALALPIPRTPAPNRPPLPRVAPYADDELSVADLEPQRWQGLADDYGQTFIDVHYDGTLAAVAGADAYHLVGNHASLPSANPEAQFVTMMAIYATEIASGQRSGTYTDDAARIIARISLVPAEVFERGILDRDATATAYGIPVWELGPEAVELTRRALAGA